MEKCLMCGSMKEVRKYLVKAKFEPYEKESKADVCISCSDISLHDIEAFALMKASLYQDELDNDAFTVLYHLLANISFDTYFVLDSDSKAINPSYLAEKSGITLRSFDLQIEQLWKKRLALRIKIDGDSLFLINASKFGLEDGESFRRKNFFANDFNVKRSKGSESSKRRLLRIRSLIDDFTPEDRDDVFREFGGKCALTGKEVSLHMDHVIPIAVGHGGTTKSNMLPIWQRINSSKSDRNIFEWYEENGDKFEVCPERFKRAIKYLAKLNGMAVEGYREYVYDCHANPNDKLTEVMSND